MAEKDLKGISVDYTMVPKSDSLTVTDTNYIKGGRYIAETKSEIDHLSAEKCKVGMIAYCRENGKEYILTKEPSASVTDSTDWAEYTQYADDLTFKDGRKATDVWATKTELSEAISNVESGVADKYVTKKQFTARNKKQDQSIEENANAIIEANNKITTLTSTVTTLNNRLYGNTAEQTQGDIATIKQSIQDVENKIDTELQSQIDALDKRIETNEDAIDTNADDIALVKKDVQSNKSAIDTLNTVTIADINTKISSLQGTVGNINTKDAQQDSTISSIQSDIVDLKSSDSATATSLKTITSTIGNLKSQLATTNSNVDGVKSQIGTINTTITELNSKIAANTQLINSEHTAVYKLINDNDTKYQQKFQEQTQKIETNVDSIEQINETINRHLTPGLEDANNKITALETRVDGHDSNIATINGNISNLTTRVDALDNATTGRVTKLEQTVTELTSPSGTVSQIQSQVTKLQSSLEETKQTIEETKTQLDQKIDNTKTELSNSITQNSNSITQISNTITTTINPKLTELEQKVTQNTNDIGTLKSFQTSATSQISALETKVSDNTNNLSSLKNTVESNKLAIEQTVSQLRTDLTSSINANTEKITQNKNEIGTLKTKVDKNTNDIASINTLVNGLKGSSSNLVDAVNGLIDNKIAPGGTDKYALKTDFDSFKSTTTSDISGIKGRLTTAESDIDAVEAVANAADTLSKANKSGLESANSRIDDLGTTANANKKSIDDVVSSIEEATSLNDAIDKKIQKIADVAIDEGQAEQIITTKLQEYTKTENLVSELSDDFVSQTAYNAFKSSTESKLNEHDLYCKLVQNLQYRINVSEYDYDGTNYTVKLNIKGVNAEAAFDHMKLAGVADDGSGNFVIPAASATDCKLVGYLDPDEEMGIESVNSIDLTKVVVFTIGYLTPDNQYTEVRKDVMQNDERIIISKVTSPGENYKVVIGMTNNIDKNVMHDIVAINGMFGAVEEATGLNTGGYEDYNFIKTLGEFDTDAIAIVAIYNFNF